MKKLVLLTAKYFLLFTSKIRKDNFFCLTVFVLSSMFLFGCNNKNNQSLVEKELAEQVAYENKIRDILTDGLCKSIIQEAFDKELKLNVSAADGVMNLYRDPSSYRTSLRADGAIDCKIKGKKGLYLYQIALSNFDNNNLTQTSTWVLDKLIIRESQSLEKVFFAGKGTCEVGDDLIIDGKKVTLISNNGIAQKFESQSKLSKEQIMKLWNCRERPKANILYLYLPNQKRDYASYIDGQNALFLYSPDRVYEVKEVGNNKYEFTPISL